MKNEKLDSLAYADLMAWLEEQNKAPWTRAMWNHWWMELNSHDGVPSAEKLHGRLQRFTGGTPRALRLTPEQRRNGFEYWQWEWLLRSELPRYTCGILRNVIRDFQRNSFSELTSLVNNPAPSWAYRLQRVVNPASRYRFRLWAVTGYGVLHETQTDLVKDFTIRLCNRIKAVLAFRDALKSDLDGK